MEPQQLPDGDVLTIRAAHPYDHILRSSAAGVVMESTQIRATMSGCGIVDFEVSKSGNWIATGRSSGQGEWGYDVVGTNPLARRGGTLEKRGYGTLPKFSANEDRVVGGCGENWLGGWWAHPNNDFEFPARGGEVTFGWVFIHRLPSHEVSWHELRMNIPSGWLPADPFDMKWHGPSVIEPFGEGFQFVLPSGKAYEYEGPLPNVVELETPETDGD